LLTGLGTAQQACGTFPVSLVSGNYFSRKSILRSTKQQKNLFLCFEAKRVVFVG
jgi:hypothetical protein